MLLLPEGRPGKAVKLTNEFPFGNQEASKKKSISS
jgi:hypothetical protein